MNKAQLLKTVKHMTVISYLLELTELFKDELILTYNGSIDDYENEIYENTKWFENEIQRILTDLNIDYFVDYSGEDSLYDNWFLKSKNC